MSDFPAEASVFPLEIFHEIILYSDASSDHQTLASLSGVSRSLLEFAGPLLYKHVVLTKSEHVIPFLERLRLPRAPSDPPLLLPFDKIIKVTVLALPPAEELEALSDRTDLVRDPTLWTGGVEEVVIGWGPTHRDNLETFWAPRLILVLDPKRMYLGKRSDIEKDDCFEGCLLRVYVHTISLDNLPPSSSLRAPHDFDPSNQDSIYYITTHRCSTVRDLLGIGSFEGVPEILNLVAGLAPLEKEPLEGWARELGEAYEGLKRHSLLRCNSHLLVMGETISQLGQRQRDAGFPDDFGNYVRLSKDRFRKIYKSLGQETTKNMAYEPALFLQKVWRLNEAMQNHGAS